MPTDSSRRRAAAVTGGAAGIGLATCREFLSRGMAVAIVDRDAGAARKTADELRATMADATQKVVPAPADVRDSAAVDAAIGAAVEEMGGLDVLVNCAGITDRAPAAEMTDESWTRMLDVHLSGTFRCCRAAFQALRDSDTAAIVNVSSVAAYLGFPLRASYCAAKSGIEAVTRSLAVEWAAHGIRVNAVAPTWVRTFILEDAVARGVLDEATIEAITPLGGVVEPFEVAKAIAFLASPDARMITGQSLVIDGGFVINPHV